MFVLQTWVPCVRSSDFGPMCSFFRLGYFVFDFQVGSLFVLQTLVLCVRSSDLCTQLCSLCSFYILGFSVFDPQTWVLSCRSSDFGSLWLFVRLAFSVFVLQACVLCVRSLNVALDCSMTRRHLFLEK